MRTEGLFSTLREAVATARSIKHDTISNLPNEVIKALNSSSFPEFKLMAVIGITERILAGSLGGGAKLGNKLKNFIELCKRQPSATFEYYLDGINAQLSISKKNGQVKARLDYFFSLSKEIKEKAESLGIEVKDPNKVTTKDLRDAIKLQNPNSPNPEKLLMLIGDIDEVLTKNRLMAYADGNGSKIQQLHELHDLTSSFLTNANAINPYASRTFYLGDNESSITINVDRNDLSIALKTPNPKIKQEFYELFPDLSPNPSTSSL